MKNVFIIIIGWMVVCMDSFAIDHDIKLSDQNISGKRNQHTVPVHVDISQALLGIHFTKKVQQVFTTVVGPNGIIYQREITTDTAKSIYVDLAQYQNGEYSIYFQDAEGNEVSGDFLLTE